MNVKKLTTQEIVKRVGDVSESISSQSESLLQSVTRLLNEKAQLETQLTVAKQTISDLHEFAYERAPKLAAEEANKQIEPLKAEIEQLHAKLDNEQDHSKWADDHIDWLKGELNKSEAEIERLRSELNNIANAACANDFISLEGFRVWVKNRARHALGQEAGTLVIKK